MTEPREPLDEDIERLLEAERRRPSVPDVDREALREALSRATGVEAWRLLLRSRALFAALGLAVGIGVGPYVHEAGAPSQRIAPAPVRATAAPLEAVIAPAPPPSSTPAPPRERAPTERAKKEPAVSSLGVERSQIETARSAILRGDHAAAIAILEEHESQFSHGRLREEREALMVRVLAATGRNQEATARAERFRGEYPQSLLMPVVDAALR
jgi:hypothetical protein